MIEDKTIYEKYPESWEKYNEELDRLFPKGDERRGDALVLGTMIFIAMNKETKQQEEQVLREYTEWVYKTYFYYPIEDDQCPICVKGEENNHKRWLSYVDQFIKERNSR